MSNALFDRSRKHRNSDAPRFGALAKRPCFFLFLLAVFWFCSSPQPLHAMPYGVGSTWVKRVLGQGDWNDKELKNRISELEGKLAQSPSNPELNYGLAILKLNSRQSIKLDSIRDYLEKFLTTNPGYEDALDLWLNTLPKKDELEKMSKAMEAYLKSHAGDPHATFFLGECRRKLGGQKEAIQLFESLNASENAYIRGRALLSEAIACFELGDDVHGSDLYNKFIDQFQELDSRLWDILYSHIYLVASEEEKDGLDTTSPQDRGEFIHRFWKRRDPKPMTPENERLGSHYRRLREAEKKFPLNGNGNGYFTNEKDFLELSPELDYYKSKRLFRYLQNSFPWLDMRGLIFIRHGEAERIVRLTVGQYQCYPRSRETCTVDRSETWVYSETETQPFIFHFIRRRGINEYVLAVNLAVAAIRNPSGQDDPSDTTYNIADIRPIYDPVSYYSDIFRALTLTTSRTDIENLLHQEAQMMGDFIRAGIGMDNPDGLEKKLRLDFNLSSVDFKTSPEKTEPRLFYSIPLSDQKFEPKPKELEFDSVALIYDRHWKKEVGRASDNRKAPLPAKGQKDINLVGELLLPELEPDTYNFALELTEKSTGKTGLAKGKYIVPYFGGSWVEASDLVLAESVEIGNATGGPFFHKGSKIVPIPSSIVMKEKKAYIYYEIYNLTKDDEGKVKYKVNLSLLTLQKKPSVLKKAFSIGLGVARMFFPYEMFITDAAFFGIGAARKSDKRGIVKEEGIHEEILEGDTKVVYFEFDPSKYPKGIYQLYITIEDLQNKSITTKDIRMMID